MNGVQFLKQALSLIWLSGENTTMRSELHSLKDWREMISTDVHWTKPLICDKRRDRDRTLRLFRGELINIIPRESRAVFAVQTEFAEAAVAILREKASEIFVEHAIEDPDLAIVSAAESKRLLNLLLIIPHGCMRRSPFAEFDGTVDASMNLAVAKLGQSFDIQVSLRGAILPKCTELEMTAKTAVEMAGFPFVCESQYFAVPWVPNVHSRLARLMVETYEEIHGVKKALGLLPCTIETAAFVQLGYDAEMVAISPSVPMAHHIGEFVDLAECVAWKSVILRLLGKLRE
jgi:dipeptidase D